MSTYSATQFLIDDYPRTLFPLSTTLSVLNGNERLVSDYIYQKVLNNQEESYSFLSQTRVFSSKSGLHLRRTVKLDPVAEYFIYDLVYRNRANFRKDFSSTRRSYGYRFESGQPISASLSYQDFRNNVSEANKLYKHSIKGDVATYFNSIYHHDIVAQFSNKGWVDEDIQSLGLFLREANTGRSVDCLPQGLYPCKMIGSEFLKIIDNAFNLRCSLMLRFMDDFYLFDNNESVLNEDFLTIQQHLGEKGLSLNASKTIFGKPDENNIAHKVNDIKISLLRARRRAIQVSGIENEESNPEPLNSEQIEYLLDLLKEHDIDESDAELVLVLLRDQGLNVLEYMYNFLERFPSLSRNVYNYSKYVADKSELSTLLLKFSKQGKNVTEDQLFWIAKIAEEHLSGTINFPNLLLALYEHPKATTISKSKILEIPETRFSLSSLREEHLKVGKSDWLAWSSACGTRNDKPISRNHMLGYFAKASNINNLIYECVKNIS
jgi:hypothetical protein